MDFREFQEKGSRTIIRYDEPKGSILTAMLSLVGEAGEIVEQFNDRDIKGIAFNRDHLVEELGDVLWGCNYVVTLLNLDLQNILNKHISDTNYSTNEVVDFNYFSRIVNNSNKNETDKDLNYFQLFIHCASIAHHLEKYFDNEISSDSKESNFLKETYIRYISADIGKVVELISHIASDELNVSLENVADYNVSKLQQRFANKSITNALSNPSLYNSMKLANKNCWNSAIVFNAVTRYNTPDFIEVEKDILNTAFRYIIKNLDNIRKLNGLGDENMDSIQLNSEIDVQNLFEFTTEQIKNMVVNNCIIADCFKKAHYRNAPVDIEKLAHNSELVLKSVIEIRDVLGIPVKNFDPSDIPSL